MRLCSSIQIPNGAILKTHTGQWRVIKGSSQIQATCGTIDISRLLGLT